MRTGGAAVVTGAAAGIGAAIARRLAADGFAVVVADLDLAGADARAGELRADGLGALAVRCDVRDAASCDRLVAEAVGWAGTLEALVNNAGITGPHRGLAEYPLDAMEAVVATDLLGTMHCTRAAIPAMVGQGRGRIVNIASVAAVHGNPNLAPYAAAKAGVVALTRSVGKELAGTGVLVNAVAPGGVSETSIAWGMDHVATDSARGATLAATPLGRLARPEEVAAMVSWLCSPECSYSTGAVFDVSGGRGAT